VALLSGLAFAACTQDNPWFGLVSDSGPVSETSETSEASETSGAGDVGGPATGSDPGTGDATTTSGAPTTGDAGTTGVMPGPAETDASTSTSTNGDSEADSTTSGDSTGSEPVVIDVPAEVGTCVLLADNFPPRPHGSPKECEAISAALAGAKSGVMALDTSLFDGGGYGREARIFLKFKVPAAPDGKVLSAATLTMRVDESEFAAGPQTGKLVSAAPFDLEDLQNNAPQIGDPLAAAAGPAISGEAVHWSLDDLGPIVPEAAVFLALVALNDDGLVFRSASAEDQRPLLTLTFE